MTRFCEFTGDDKLDHDQVPPKDRRCIHLGYKMPEGKNWCLLHKEEVGKNEEGWRTCCKSCNVPHQIKKVV